MNKATTILITILTIILLMGFFVAMFLFEPFYQSVTQPYFNFLESNGYYEYLYQPSCYKYCPLNLIHDGPYIIFYMLPIIGTFAFLFYKLSDDKAYLKQVFSKNFDPKLKNKETNNKKHNALFFGILIFYYSTIFIFLVLPLIILLVTTYS